MERDIIQLLDQDRRTEAVHLCRTLCGMTEEEASKLIDDSIT
jgi:succinyl-CoA synthetase alpha subunit